MAGFALAGGIKEIDFLHLTESDVSVDSPAEYIVYYGVLLIMLVLNLTVDKRGGCHSICWMSPFITAGYRLVQLLRLPAPPCEIRSRKMRVLRNLRQKLPNEHKYVRFA